MITSAAVVGSGELLTATTLGAQVGFALFWLVFVSTFVKVWVQIELARWSISTGKPAITGYDHVPPRIADRGWMAWLVLCMFLQFLIGQAEVIGGSALAFSMLLPIGGDPFSTTSIGIWVLLLAIVAIAIHIASRYEVVEKLSTVLVVLVTLFAVIMVFVVQFTEFSWSVGDLAEGMRFQLAVGGMGVALAMFGMTGVGAGEITAYTYWCVEKGFAAWTGPNAGSESWVNLARGWIKVMKLDAWVSWVIYTISTVAFYMLGAAVLHPQSLRPEGTDVLEVISSIFSSTVGEWGGIVFLVGAGVALFKTIVANVPSLPGDHRRDPEFAVPDGRRRLHAVPVQDRDRPAGEGRQGLQRPAGDLRDRDLLGRHHLPRRQHLKHHRTAPPASGGNYASTRRPRGR